MLNNRPPPQQRVPTGPMVRRTFRTLRVLDASDTVKSQGALIVLYGHGGVGKTTTAAKVTLKPEWYPGIIIDAESGSKAIADMDIKVHSVSSWLEVKEVVDMLAEAPNLDELVYKLFIFDSMTKIEKMCLLHHQATDSRGAQRYPELQHHGKVKLDIQEMVTKLQDVVERHRVIIVLNAWEKLEHDQESNIARHEINFIPSLTSTIPGMVDYIGWMTFGSFGKRELSFAGSRESSAKMRRPATGLPSKIPLDFKFDIHENPLGDILDTLLGGKGVEYKICKTRCVIVTVVAVVASSTSINKE